MKKTIYLLLLSFLAVSCYEEIVLPVGDDTPRGVMNAQLNTMETSHTVYLSATQKSHVRALSGADVRVSVNGTPVATAEEIPARYEGAKEACYAFDAAFKPGDEIRIEARKDAFSMSATVTVPQPVTISSVDTSTVRMTYMGETDTYLQAKTVFQDLPGSSFYRVLGWFEEDFRYLDEDGNPVPDYYGDNRGELGVETGFDPIISEGAGKTGATDIAAMLAEENNSYPCFADIPFAGQEATIRPLFHPYNFQFGEYRYGGCVPDVLQDDDDRWSKLHAYSLEIHRRISVQVRTLDFSQYHYLKALMNLDTFGTDLLFLVEPTTLPSNVEGGLGFVGLETVSEYLIYEGSHLYPPTDDTYYGGGGFNYGGYYDDYDEE